MTTINNLPGTLTTPATGDLIAVRDIDEAGTNKDKKMALSSLDDLFVDLTGTQTISGAKTFAAPLVVASLYTNQVSINDDAVHSFTPAVSQGTLMVIPASLQGQQNYFALIYFRVTTGTLDCVSLLQLSTGVSVGTTELTAGTSDGVDNNLNVHAYNGSIYIKNRRGGTRVYSYLVMG